MNGIYNPYYRTHSNLESSALYTEFYSTLFITKQPEKLYLLGNNFHEETRQHKKAHVQEIKVSMRIVTMLLSCFYQTFSEVTALPLGLWCLLSLAAGV